MQRLGGRTEAGGFGKPGVRLMSAGHKECEAKLCLRRFTFILKGVSKRGTLR